MQQKQILFEGYELIQDDRFLKLTQDTVLLSDFVKVRKGERVLDLGAGIGSLGILLLVKNDGIYTDGIEILPEAAQLARENYRNCGFSQRGEIVTGDFKQLKNLGKGRYDVCVSNPPYFDVRRGKMAEQLWQSRAEENGTIFDVCRGGKAVLKAGGRLYFCYKPERLDSGIKAMQDCGFALKRLQFVHQSRGKAANLVLIEGRLMGGEGCVVEPPILIE